MRSHLRSEKALEVRQYKRKLYSKTRQLAGSGYAAPTNSVIGSGQVAAPVRRIILKEPDVEDLTFDAWMHRYGDWDKGRSANLPVFAKWKKMHGFI